MSNKLSAGDFKGFSKEEKELLSMVATMTTGGAPVVEPTNLHFMTKKGMKDTIEMMKKEQKNMSSKGKKVVQSILRKSSGLTEQYTGVRDEEEERIRRMAMGTMQNMKRGMEKMAPQMKGMMQPGAVRPLETGQPGAVSADLGFKDLAGMVRKPSLPSPPSVGGPPMPSLTDRPPMPEMSRLGGRPGMPKMPPMGMPKPPMGAGGPPMGMPRMPKPPMGAGGPPMGMPGMPPMGMPKKPKAPSMDDQPGLPPKPPTPPMGAGGPPMGMPGMGGPPKETDGPRAMEPSKDFAQRMGIKKVERHHLRPEEDSVPMDVKPSGAPGPGPGMPGAPMMPQRQEGPVPGQPVPPQFAGIPGAPKEMPRQLPPGTTEASQEFLDKYAQQIKSFLKDILDQEKRKFAVGRDLTAMPKAPMKEQFANAVGGGMSPVMGNEGGVKGRDKMLGRTGGMRRRMEEEGMYIRKKRDKQHLAKYKRKAPEGAPHGGYVSKGDGKVAFNAPQRSKSRKVTGMGRRAKLPYQTMPKRKKRVEQVDEKETTYLDKKRNKRNPARDMRRAPDGSPTDGYYSKGDGKFGMRSPSRFTGAGRRRKRRLGEQWDKPVPMPTVPPADHRPGTMPQPGQGPQFDIPSWEDIWQWLQDYWKRMAEQGNG